MAFSEGQSYTELATEMGAQALCGMRKDTKKKKQQRIQKASGREGASRIVGGNSCLWHFSVGNGTSGGLFKISEGKCGMRKKGQRCSKRRKGSHGNSSCIGKVTKIREGPLSEKKAVSKYLLTHPTALLFKRQKAFTVKKPGFPEGLVQG